MPALRRSGENRLHFLACVAAAGVIAAAMSVARPALGQSTPQGPASQPATAPPAPPAATPPPASQPAVAAPAASGAAAAPLGCDASCVRQNMDRAAQACAPRIEAQAPTDFEWLSRPFGGVFQQAEPPDAGKTVVLYRGDSIRFLSPQKEWVRVTYECGFDVALQRLTQANVRLGRLNQPAQAAAAAPAQGSAAAAAAQASRAEAPAPMRPMAKGGIQPAQPVNQSAAPRKLSPNEPTEIEVRQVDPRALPKR